MSLHLSCIVSTSSCVELLPFLVLFQVLAVESTSGLHPDEFGLLVDVEGGTTSDSSWKCSYTYEPLWTHPEFNDTHWQPALELGKSCTHGHV